MIKKSFVEILLSASN